MARAFGRAIATQASEGQLLWSFRSQNPGTKAHYSRSLRVCARSTPTASSAASAPILEAVVARHGIEAIPITSRTARIWDRDVPLARRVPLALVGMGAELAHYARAFRELKGTDMLIVPGTGAGDRRLRPFLLGSIQPVQVGGSWRSCAAAGCCSSASGQARSTTRSGGFWSRRTLSLADYRSYRDEASSDCLRAIGFRAEQDPVYPDLVFSLPEALLPRDPPDREAGGASWVSGLMAYAGKYSAADPRPETYNTYLKSLAMFATWLLEHDYDIRLLLGDEDTFVIDEFRSALQAQLGSYDEERIIEPPITSVRDILAELGATDVVIATRFHNVLLAIAPQQTRDRDFVSSQVLFVDAPDEAIRVLPRHQSDGRRQADRAIPEARAEPSSGQATIARGTAEARAALDQQYDLLFAWPSPPFRQ